MKRPVFTGSAVALVTPFRNGTVNYDALARLIERQLAEKTDALVVCGTTGEPASMTYKEKLDVIAFCVDRAAGRVPVIAGTGANSTEVARLASQDAERLGADALLVVTPYYNKTSQVGLLRHFFTVADAVRLPIILYNVPSRTGMRILPETYAELAKHENIAGVKEAGSDFSAVQRMRNLCPEDFYLWSGNDEETADLCLLGAVGVISVVANVLPAEMHRLAKLCLDGDFGAAGKLQLKLKSVCDAMFCEVNPIPVKTALNLMGLHAGELRLPLCPPSEAHLRQIKAALREWKLIE